MMTRSVIGEIRIAFDQHDYVTLTFNTEPRTGADAQLLSSLFTAVGTWLACHVPLKED